MIRSLAGALKGESHFLVRGIGVAVQYGIDRAFAHGHGNLHDFVFGEASSVAIRVAFSSALSIVSNEESSVYETRCSVMAMDEVKIEYTAWRANCPQSRRRRSPEAIPGECGSLPVGWRNCQR